MTTTQQLPVARSASAERARDFGGRLARWWLPIGAIALIIASDYKFRTRPPTDALSATVDREILIEFGLYVVVAAYLLILHGGHVVPRTGRAPTRRLSPQTYFACLFVGVMALSLLYTPFRTYATVRVAQMLVLLALILAASVHANRAHFHRFLHAYLVLITVSVAYGVVVPATPLTASQRGRFTWLFIHPTVSGALTGLATVIAAGYVAHRRELRNRPGPKWPPVAYIVCFGVVGTALVTTKTRGAIIAGAIGVVVVVLSLRRGRAFLRAAAAILAVTAVTAIAIGPTVATYLERGATSEQLTTLSERTRLWDVAIDSVKETPEFGHGVTAAQGIFLEETGLGGGHNAVVHVLVELGVVGLLTWLALVGTLFVGTRRLARDGPESLDLDRALLLGILTFLMVDGIVFQGPAEVTNVASTFLLVCVAWLTVAQRKPVVVEAPQATTATKSVLRMIQRFF
jgi:O-antigen ligase